MCTQMIEEKKTEEKERLWRNTMWGRERYRERPMEFRMWKTPKELGKHVIEYKMVRREQYKLWASLAEFENEVTKKECVEEKQRRKSCGNDERNVEKNMWNEKSRENNQKDKISNREIKV